MCKPHARHVGLTVLTNGAACEALLYEIVGAREGELKTVDGVNPEAFVGLPIGFKAVNEILEYAGEK